MCKHQQSIHGAIVVDTERCKGCGLCIDVCKFQLIRLSEHVNHKGYHYAEQTDHTSCNGCTSCGINCPDGCIAVYRIKSTSQPGQS